MSFTSNSNESFLNIFTTPEAWAETLANIAPSGAKILF